MLRTLSGARLRRVVELLTWCSNHFVNLIFLTFFNGLRGFS